MPIPGQPDKIPDKEFSLTLPDASTGGSSILMIASTRAGKTTLMKYIMRNYFKKHFGVLFSESAKSPAYSDFNYDTFPKSSVFIPELIHDAYKINKELKNYYNFLFLLDDCPLVKGDKQMLKLTTIYRNSGLSCITCVQSPSLLSPTQRSNFNIICLGRCNTTAQTEANIKAYLRGVFPDGLNYDQKIRLYDEMTRDHHWIILNQYSGEIFRTKIHI
jgi:hypothetical protein